MKMAQKNINIVFLLLFSAYAIYSVIYQQSSIFFIVYLFWFDEVIRSISAFIQVKMYHENEINTSLTKKLAISNIKSRFFFLFVYAVFIVIAFGIFFHLSKTDIQPLYRNLQILLFRDMAFNVCLMIAVVREVLQIRMVSLNRNAQIPSFSAMSGNLLTLHLSIILGGFLWAITSGKFTQLSFSLGSFDSMQLFFLSLSSNFV